jgi:hypothetical protein
VRISTHREPHIEWAIWSMWRPAFYSYRRGNDR